MPKKSTPDADLKPEFANLKSLAREEKQARTALDKIVARKRKAVSAMAKKGANVSSMASVFNVSRQALAKDIRLSGTKAPAKKTPAKKKAPAKRKAPSKTRTAPAKAPAKRKAPAKAPVAETTTNNHTTAPAPAPVEAPSVAPVAAAALPAKRIVRKAVAVKA